MTPERWQAIKTLFPRVSELKDPLEQRAYLEAACGTDVGLREEIERMLTAASDPALEDGVSLQGKTIGPYQILERIGQGVSGTVYKARDTQLGRFVALKLLHHPLLLDDEALRRFLQEPQHLSVLNHPNIVTIYGVERIGPSVALVMEYVDGQTLAALLKAGPLSTGVARDYALQIAAALAAAHAQGITHRDLKPSNILVSKEGILKVVDFGLAKVAASAPQGGSTPGQTQPGLILGSAPYMSPEQVRGKAVDARSDIFCFGVLIHEMLTGIRPFQDESVVDIMANILRDSAPELPESLPDALKDVVARCLQKDPQARFQSVQELIAALRGEDLPAMPAAERRSSFLATARRWRWPAGIAGAVLVGGLFLVFWPGHPMPGGVSAHAEADQAGVTASAFDRAIDLQRKAIATGCFAGGDPTCDVQSALANSRASVVELDAILKTHPRHVPSTWNRGLAYADLCALHRRLEQWPQALEACEHAITDFSQALVPGITYEGLPTSHPNEADVLFNRGLTYQQKADIRPFDVKGKVAELAHAVADYDQILQNESQYGQYLKKRKGDISKAKQIAQEMREGLMRQRSKK
jgi:hypothetical protein